MMTSDTLTTLSLMLFSKNRRRSCYRHPCHHYPVKQKKLRMQTRTCFNLELFRTNSLLSINILIICFTIISKNHFATSAPRTIPECIRYEIHESTMNSSQFFAITSDCERSGGYLEKLSHVNLSTYPMLINSTFECCMDKRCSHDLDCAFNFQCDRRDGRCFVSSCQLTDDYDLVVNERIECLFDDDCLFYAPFDKGNWGCVQVCPGEHGDHENDLNCRKCKRCPSEPRIRFNETNLWSNEDTLIEVPVIPSTTFTTERLSVDSDNNTSSIVVIRDNHSPPSSSSPSSLTTNLSSLSPTDYDRDSNNDIGIIINSTSTTPISSTAFDHDDEISTTSSLTPSSSISSVSSITNSLSINDDMTSPSSSSLSTVTTTEATITTTNTTTIINNFTDAEIIRDDGVDDRDDIDSGHSSISTTTTTTTEIPLFASIAESLASLADDNSTTLVRSDGNNEDVLELDTAGLTSTTTTTTRASSLSPVETIDDNEGNESSTATTTTTEFTPTII